jgi:bifunctional ADP-heptose synthase (sugar kinase/adenylyltransferase)
LGAQGTLEQGCELANMAAGYVVGEVGTTTCPLAVLEELVG